MEIQDTLNIVNVQEKIFRSRISHLRCAVHGHERPRPRRPPQKSKRITSKSAAILLNWKKSSKRQSALRLKLKDSFRRVVPSEGEGARPPQNSLDMDLLERRMPNHRPHPIRPPLGCHPESVPHHRGQSDSQQLHRPRLHHPYHVYGVCSHTVVCDFGWVSEGESSDR